MGHLPHTLGMSEGINIDYDGEKYVVERWYDDSFGGGFSVLETVYEKTLGEAFWRAQKKMPKTEHGWRVTKRALDQSVNDERRGQKSVEGN